MNRSYLAALLLIILNHTILVGQDKDLSVSVSVFNNGTSLPGTGYLGVFSKTIHPGIAFAAYYPYRTREKHEFFQSVKLGYFYHRFVQHGIQLYTEGGYRYITKSGIFAEALLGVGYLHSFSDLEVFVFQDGGYTRKPKSGRPGVMFSTGIAGGYDLQNVTNQPLQAFLLYQFWMQSPFVNNYVPLLPNTSLHLGVRYRIAK